MQQGVVAALVAANRHKLRSLIDVIPTANLPARVEATRVVASRVELPGE
jgi:hypothetical protein